MRKLSNNPTFLRHKFQISEAIEATSGVTKANGKDLYREILLAADALDEITAPVSGIRPDPHLISVRRDEFHKRCRDMGVWLEEHAPDLKLDWNS
jgi:hypothetical protein